jgi:prepilin-type N-terminal cleavage/methylation domain-containing protein
MPAKSLKKIFFKKALKKAFSLIELSAAIIIIGILIAGTIKGTKIIKNYQLISARNLTQGAPVAGIKNLVSWFETTSEASFDSTIDSDSSTANKVANWYDINPQSNTKNNAYQTVTANQPTYVTNVINGLPVVRFVNSSALYLNLPDGTVPYNNSAYTIFFVSKVNSLGGYGLLGSGTYGSNNSTNCFRYDAANYLKNYWWNADITSTSGAIAASKFYIIDFYYDLSNRKIYINGTLNTTLSSGNNSSTSSNNSIGKTYNTEYMDGDIAEIIIYNRALSDLERKAIETYLSRKWAIAIQTY